MRVDVEAVQRLRAEGQTWRQVAQALKAPRRTLECACSSEA